MDNTVVETKQCQHCQLDYDITQSDLDFYHKISPIYNGQKFQIPTPTLCPDCRQRRRLSFRNERKLYKRLCDASGQGIVSAYAPNQADYNKSVIVYDQKIWWGESWDPISYGFEFDFDKTFTENFRDLLSVVPLSSLSQVACEGCDYTNLIGYSKDCYLSFACANFDTCVYCHYGNNSDNVMDSTNISDCHYSYQLVECRGCYDVLYAYASVDCSQCIGIINCRSCNNCIDCQGLQNQQYMINNIQYSKQEYESYKATINFIKLIESYNKNTLLNFDTCINSTESTGRFLTDCDNCIECSSVVNSQDCKNILYGNGATDVHDSYAVYPGIMLMYDSVASIDGSNNLFSYMSTRPNNLLYCFYCDVCSDCFGCMSLKNKKYCIFNKQYTKQEYEIQVAKIIQHMVTTGERGEFFHPSLSPFGYNETVAQEYFPLTSSGGTKAPGKKYSWSDLVLTSMDSSSSLQSSSEGQQEINFAEHGYHRSHYEAPTPQVDKVIKGQDLPDAITDVDDDILKVAIQCEVSGKPFRIIPQELAFYRKHNIPLPRKHPDVRHLERMELRK